MRTPKALFFDVFGTCVDWRTTVIRAGERPWAVLDVLHRETLDVVAVDFQALADALTAPNR